MLVGPLYNKIRETPEKFIVCQGGGDAGKTVSILQAMGSWSCEKKSLISTVVGQDVPNLKGGSLRAFKMYVEPDPGINSYITQYNETARGYKFSTNSYLEFKSFADEQDARGSERHVLFVNEANFIDYQTFWQLQRKTRWKVIVDYNPTSAFWVHEKLLPGPTQDKQYAGKVKRYIVDHRHNLFLDAETHESYENISDPDMFRVYSRGFTGAIKGLIFGHFKKAHELPKDYDRIIWGIDYGYTIDPTALVKIYCKGRQRYVEELCYEPGITAIALKQLLFENGYDHGQELYSERDADMINQLIILGINVQPAMKSIKAGISKVKEYECFHYNSPFFETEILRYKWIEANDIVTGKQVLTDIVTDAWNHICDAVRYALYSDSFMNEDLQ